MKIQSKLLLNAVLSITCLLFAGGIGYFFTNYVANISLSIVKSEAIPLVKVDKIEKTLSEVLRYLVIHSAMTDPDGVNKIEQVVGAMTAMLDKELADYEEMIRNTETSSVTGSVVKFKNEWAFFSGLKAKALQLSNAYAKEDALKVLTSEGRESYDRMLTTLRECGVYHQESMNRAVEHSTAAKRNAIIWIVILTLLLGVSVIVGGILISRSIIKPIGGEPAHVAEIAQKISRGDLTVEFAEDGKTGPSIFTAMKTMTEKLRQIVVDVQKATDNLPLGSQEFSKGPVRMSQGATSGMNDILTETDRADELGGQSMAFESMADQLRGLIAGLEQRENELCRISLFQRTILDNAAHGIISTDPEGFVTSFNRSAERLLGYSAEEVVGKLTPECWHDPDEIAQRAIQLSEELDETVLPGFDVFAARSRRNLPEENEWTFIRRDGTRVPVLLSVTSLRDESGRITGFVGLTYDLTERKRAEESLRRLNRQLRAISDCNQSLMRANEEQTLLNDICRIICDHAGYRMAWVGYAEQDEGRSLRPVAFAGVEDGYIAEARLSWGETERGRGPAGMAIRGGTTIAVQDLSRSQEFAPWLESALKRGYRSGIGLPLKDERMEVFGVLLIYSAEINAFSLEEINLLEELAGDLAFGITVLRGRFQQRKLEDQLRQSQKMEAIGTLAGGIAHDFNNILTAIIGYGNIVKMKMPPNNPLRPSIDQILTSADRAARLTQGLLAFSRKQVINPQPVDLNDVVRNVEKLLQRIIGEDISLSTQLSKKSLIAMADSAQIEQVLMNFAANARDAMPGGGALTISTQEMDIGDDFVAMHGFGEPGKYALIAVSDTGQGMDEQTRDKIFEPFFTTKEMGKGTGLGLAIVYGIIKQHNGYINVYSEPGKGSTFKIYLPQIVKSVVEAVEEIVALPRGGKETILLAEDDQEVRSLVAMILKDYGYRVIEAVDGQDALDKFAGRSGEIDLLILDVIMPRKSGKDVYNAIKAEFPEISTLFISGYTADIIHKKGISDTGLEFISKPVSPFEMLRKIREIIDTKQRSHTDRNTSSLS